MSKLPPIEAAQKFIAKHFPTCDAALLAGSVIRGEGTETSDLDIVVFDNNLSSAYRESLIEFDWAVEVFVHNFTSYQHFFKTDVERARPSLPRMVSEGIILKDHEFIDSVKKEAILLLEKGPEKWTIETITLKRYFLTDALHDFIGCSNRAEGIFVANTLAELVSEFVLRTNGRWIGVSKWVVRSLKQYDEEFANRFVAAFDLFYTTNDKQQVIEIVEEVLKPYGGELFAGFSLGKS